MTLTLGLSQATCIQRHATPRRWLLHWILAPAVIGFIVLWFTACTAGAELTPTIDIGLQKACDTASGAAFAITTFAVLAAVWAVIRSRSQQLQTEISQRCESERALLEREALLNRVLAASSNGFWEWDIAANKLWFSRRCAELLGCADAGLPISAIEWMRTLNAADSAHFVAAVCRHLDARRPLDFVCQIPPVDGESGEVRICGETERDSSGAPQRLFGSVQEFRDSPASWETLQLQNGSLKKQRLESIGQLAGGIAHEFNNLLHVIRCYTEFALESIPESCAARQDLQPVLSSTNRAAKLTRQMLDFSRSDEAKLERVDVNEVLADLFVMLRPLLGERVELQFRLSDNVSEIDVDAVMIQQAIMNLCINARDAMPDGGVLTVATDMTEVSSNDCQLQDGLEPGRYVRFSVADSGGGMPPHVQEHIFEPFFTTKDVGKGTGLGLSMVYGIVKRHRGVVRVCSKVGAGATFTVYLPCGEKPQE